MTGSPSGSRLGEGAEGTGGKPGPRLARLWLEITAKCQLECTHCYADSGPWGTHGAMTAQDWHRVIDQAHDLGVKTILFIGGEPMLHPHLGELVERALRPGVEVRVLSNLVHVPDTLWEFLGHPNVTVCTSYHSYSAAQHDARTRRRGSHARTTANLRRAAERGVRVSAMVVREDGRAEAADTAALEALGVSRHGVDRVRLLGRAAVRASPRLPELCGQCSGSLLTVGPDGVSFPCPMARWLQVGSVRESSLAAVVGSASLREARQEIAHAFDPDVTGRPAVVLREECFGAADGGEGGGCGP